MANNSRKEEYGMNGFMDRCFGTNFSLRKIKQQEKGFDHVLSSLTGSIWHSYGRNNEKCVVMVTQQ
jgi:hypothetical protein